MCGASYVRRARRTRIDRRSRFIERLWTGTPLTMDPASYTQLGAYLYQFAARYGRTKVADDMLTLGADQARLTGKGWLAGLEVRNEANGPWQGRQGFMTPVEQVRQVVVPRPYPGRAQTVP